MTNLNIWKTTFIFLKKRKGLKLTFFIANSEKLQALVKHKNGIRGVIPGSQWKESITLKIVVSFFPFIFGISYIIYSRYRNQTFSYFFNKNLPGAYSFYPQLTWQTFEHITSFKLQSEPILSNLNKIKDPSLTPNESLMSNNMISSNELNRNFKTNVEKTSLVNFNNLSDDQSQDKNFYFKQNLINRINPEFKKSPFIKQLDFYNDSILIKLNSKWQHKKKQNYVGVFSKLSDRNFYSWLNQSNLLTLPLRFKKGLCSLQGDNIDKLGSYIEKDFTERKNLVKKQEFFNLQKRAFNIGNNWGLISPQYSSFPSLGYKLPSIKDNWEFFYLNLDELPKKLNSSQTLKSITELPRLKISRTNQILPIKNKYFFFIESEHQNFLQDALIKNTNLKSINSQQKVAFFNNYKEAYFSWPDRTNLGSPQSQATLMSAGQFEKRRLQIKQPTLNFKPRQISNLFGFQPFTKILKEFNVNFLSFASGHCLTLKKVSQNSNLAEQLTLSSKNNKPIQALDGFSGNFDFHQYLKVPPILKSPLWKKLDLLQDQVKAEFYENGFTFQGVMTNLLNFQFPLFIKENKNINQIKDYILENNLTNYKNLISLLGDSNLLRKSSDNIFFNKKITDSTQQLHTLVDNQTTQNNSNLNQKNHSDSLIDTFADELENSSQLENYSSEQILHILEDFIPVKPNLHLDPRSMSGYEFPDTPSKEVQLLILQSFYQNSFLHINKFLPKFVQNKTFKFWSPTLKVELPSSLTSYFTYNYSNSKPLIFKIKYRPTFLQGSKRALYQGPGVVLDDFTQDLRFTNKEETRKWIKQFFSSDNPLTTRRQTFFGQNLIRLDRNNWVNDTSKFNLNEEDILSKTNQSNFLEKPSFSASQQKKISKKDAIVDKKTDIPQNLVNLGSESNWKLTQKEFNFDKKSTEQTHSKLNFTELNKIKKQIIPTQITNKKITQSTSFFNPNVSQNIVRSLKVPILPFTEEFQIPYLSKSQWNIVLKNLKINLEEQFENKSESENNKLKGVIPLIRIRTPKQQKIQWPLNQLDYQNLNNFVESDYFKEPKVDGFHSNTRSEHFSGRGLDLIYTGLQKNQAFSLFKSKFFANYPQGTRLDISEQRAHKAVFYKDLSKKISFHYLPSANSALTQNLTENKIFGSVYKKAFTIYKNTLQNSFYSLDKLFHFNFNKKLINYLSPPFYQSWEPITVGSWMVITQLSFGFVVLLLFKDIYRKYGKELLVYVFDLLQALGIVDESFKEEFQIDDNHKSFRIIKKVPKRFRDIAGIDRILPELGELIWFLRNYGRSFKVGNILPKGILLVGSPGTGKTLLVQAIAGEAEVPVLVQSGSSLKDPEQEGGGVQTLQDLFEQARQLAPCIVFIDEIDTLGEKRENVLQNPMEEEGDQQVIESIQQDRYLTTFNNHEFIPKPKIKLNEETSDLNEQDLVDLSLQEPLGSNRNINLEKNSHVQVVQQSVDKQKSQHQQLSVLMQFLIEMDGLQSRKGVIVIGATNRPNALDLALTRPGRFDQILHIELPEKEKRIDILKFYSKNLGTENQISKPITNEGYKEVKFGFTNRTWDYLANRTIGFSAADLAAVMNESSMKAILNETVHTIETIEHGIEALTSYSTEQIKRELKNPTDPFFISRLAYYQAGKAVVHTLLLEHPSVTVLHLWPRRKNARHTHIRNLIQNHFFAKSKKFELESRIVGLYAGKAAEFLALTNAVSFRESLESTNSTKLNKPSYKFLLNENIELLYSQAQKQAFNPLTVEQSDLGIQDLSFATSLAQLMISKWYFYSKNLVIRQSSEIFSHRNWQEMSEIEKADLFGQIAIENESIQNTELNDKYQNWSIRSWWQTQIVLTTGMIDLTYKNWYRIYLANPEEIELNEDWIPPDEYYHTNNNLIDLGANLTKSSIDWHNLYAIDRDYIYHSLLLTCFNIAFSILDKNRELVDYFASYLMRNEILRQHEIADIFSQFKFIEKEKRSVLALDEKKIQPNLKSNIEARVQSTSVYSEQFQLERFKIVEKSWGKCSKRKVFHFFNFDSIVGKTSKA